MTTGLEGHTHPFYFHLDKLRIIYGELIYIPLLWFFYKSFLFKKAIRWRRVALSIWIIIPFIVFSIAVTKMQAYTLFTAPALFMVTALFWDFLYRKKWYFKFKKVINLILILLLLLPIRYSIERTKIWQIRERNPKWAVELKRLNVKIKKEKVVLFNVKRPIEAMFYTDFIAYPDSPDEKTRKELQSKGYHLYVIHENAFSELSFTEL